MGSLAIVLIIIGYVVFALWLVVKIKPWWLKPLALIAAILIPTADQYYGKAVTLPELCRKEAGLRIYRVVEDVDGFEGYAVSKFITEYGFQFLDSGDARNYRITMANGKESTEDNVASKSKYAVKLNHGELGNGFYMDEFVVIDKTTTEILSRVRNYFYVGGWTHRLLSKFTDAGGPSSISQCMGDEFFTNKTTLILRTLKPKQRSN